MTQSTLKLRAASLVASVLLSACSASQDASEPTPVALVKVAPVATGSIDETIIIYGAADSGIVGQFTLSSPVEALVRSVDAPIGSSVSPGEVVVRLLPSPGALLDLANANANASASAADAAYARAVRLRNDGLVGNGEVETARAAKLSADATRASLSRRSGALILKAPAAGFVETIGASAGQLVAAGTPIVTIVKDGDMRARFGIDPALARRIPAGSFVKVTAAGGRPSITLPVRSFDPTVDPQTKLASVYVLIPNESEIGAGESLTGTILLGSDSASITIPYAALLDDGGQPYVYVVAKGTAKRVDIAVGPRMGQRVSVTRGLTANQQVAVDRVTALEDGMKVRTK